jgi:hypothetical protein
MGPVMYAKGEKALLVILFGGLLSAGEMSAVHAAVIVPLRAGCRMTCFDFKYNNIIIL